MTPVAAAEHFAGAPDWTWYILVYFFVAGLAGGTYFLGTFLRYWGTPADEPAARLAFYVPLPATALGALMLTLDLQKPLRFWHMLFNTTPDQFGLNFNTRTPMSIGVWALVVASVFGLVAFLDALVRDGRIRHPLGNRVAAGLDGGVGRAWHVVGSVLYLFIAGYTGVLLAVSNQPVWSDSWILGGLFLASGLTGSAALILLLTRYRRAGGPPDARDVGRRPGERAGDRVGGGAGGRARRGARAAGGGHLQRAVLSRGGPSGAAKESNLPPALEAEPPG